VGFELDLAGGLPELPAGFTHRAEVVLTARDGRVWTRLVLPLRR
jgi:hypothetical protein